MHLGQVAKAGFAAKGRGAVATMYEASALGEWDLPAQTLSRATYLPLPDLHRLGMPEPDDGTPLDVVVRDVYDPQHAYVPLTLPSPDCIRRLRLPPGNPDALLVFAQWSTLSLMDPRQPPDRYRAPESEFEALRLKGGRVDQGGSLRLMLARRRCEMNVTICGVDPLTGLHAVERVGSFDDPRRGLNSCRELRWRACMGPGCGALESPEAVNKKVRSASFQFTSEDGVRMSKCARCGRAWYCSVKCQKAAWWAGHKTECRPLDEGAGQGRRGAGTQGDWQATAIARKG